MKAKFQLENMDTKEFKQEFKKRCFHFSLAVISLENSTITKQSTRIIINQLIRAATSIGANVVEGGNSTSKREFINFFQISLKSAAETLYWLMLLNETNTQLSDKIDPLICECTEIKKMLSTIILNTKNHSKF